MCDPVTLTALTTAATVAAAGTGIYAATQAGQKAQGQPQSGKDPNQNVYKDRNAANGGIGIASTGTGSLLTNPSAVAGNTLLGQ